MGNCARTLSLTAVWLILTTVLGCSQYDAATFRGDGQIQDSGPQAEPQYVITMPEIRVGHSEKREFKFSGAPSIPMTLLLRFDCPTLSPDLSLVRQKQVKDLPITLSCQLRDEKGTILCDLNGPLRAWEAAMSPISIELWQNGSRDLQIRSGTTYTLTVDVSVPEDFDTDCTLTPILEGGGWKG